MEKDQLEKPEGTAAPETEALQAAEATAETEDAEEFLGYEASQKVIEDVEEAEKAHSEEALSIGGAIRKGLKETAETFAAFAHAPREILGVNIINIFEGMAYFGTLTYLVLYMTKNVGLSDSYASYVVTAFMMVVTISQLLFGGVSDRLGAKRALGIALCILVGMRFVVGFAEPVFGTGNGELTSPLFITVFIALMIAALSYGLYQPSIYSITRQYSDKKTSAVSFAMLYAGMNLGAFCIGLALPHVRRISAEATGTNGYSGSLIFIAAMVTIALICYVGFIFFSKNKPLEESADEKKSDGQETASRKLTFKERLKSHPLADPRFDFFIFILIPVQTLFAYQNILIPAYLERCYTAYPTLSDNFETFSNINPIIVFIAAPMIAALTARANVYKMMIIGTAVMALPTFLLVTGQHPVTFLAFVLIMSIGESMWQPRFLQHVAQIAPKERVGAYIGIAQLPWFLTKFIVGLYVGHFMQMYMPDPSTAPDVVQHPEQMWFIFACVAVISPVALFLARHWCNPDAGIKKADNASRP